MAKILIIGGTGFIGKHLVSKLKNHDVSYFMRPQCDIRNFDDVLKACKDQEIIINLATPTSQDFELNRSIIVDGAKNIVKAAKINHVKKLIHLSSAAGYRKTLDNYGKSKFEADEVLKNSGLPVIILKPTMVYGKGGYAFEKMLKSIQKIPFFVPMVGNGKYKIQPAYVEDVAEIITKAVDHSTKGIEIYDLGGPYPIQYRIFIKKILKLLNKKKALLSIPVTLLSGLVRFLGLFLKHLPVNKQTIKRMTEEVELDIQKTEKIFAIKFTDYDEALKRLFS